MMSDTTLYRLLTRPAADAAAAAGRLDPVPGLDVGFIHLSTLPQARGTAAAYFSSCGDLCMLPISASALAAAGLDLRYEEAAPPAGAAQRAGEFPHVFGGSIPWSCLAAPPIDLPLVNGKHAFPGDGMNRTLTGPDQQHSRSHLEKLLPSLGQICRSPFVVRVLDQPPSGAAGGDVKLVHWIRHGQGFHNLPSDLYKEHGIQGKPYLRPELHDPPLTAVGREQAVALRSTTQSLSPSLVVVSPLARATKTALLAFDHLVGRVPFLAHESCREISGVNACDGRRSVTEAKKDFPDVDYSLMPSDEDAFFDPAVRESQAALAERGYAFLAWLRSREEGEVAVGTHSAFLFALLNAAVVADDEPGTGLRAWFAAGELRSTWIRFEPS